TVLRLVGLPRVQNGKLKVDIAKDARWYQRAQQNVEYMKAAKENIAELVREQIGADPYEMQRTVETFPIEGLDGKVVADVQVECRYDKTPYAKVVDAMQHHLNGLNYQISKGKHRNGVRRNGRNYIPAQDVLDAFELDLEGRLKLTTKQIIMPKAIAEQGNVLVIPYSSDKRINDKTMQTYSNIENALRFEENFVKKFKGKAAHVAESRVSAIPALNHQEVKAGTIDKATTNYMHVVRTLIPVPTEPNDHKKVEPELPKLAGDEYSLGQKRSLMPWYELSQEGLVSVRSLNLRISDLLNQGEKALQVDYASVRPNFR
ncbi:MAG TPA: hypothetical protein VKE88_01045, partial [Candidatus Nanoarchaeia archaeon]|nr:hypothetical protein [Candidatus Nanoarchaeia archaeon]